MMHRSDNFYAEQLLLMVSNEKLGVMNDDLIIQTLLETDLKDIPQKPQWVDGSGLSRYNLFTPGDLIFALNKMKNEFTWNRITTIFPKGGSGTLKDHFQNIHGQIYAKTGSLNNNYSLSGYLITQKGKTLIFSILAGNDVAGGTATRKAIENFLTDIINNY
jgi:D-alanyl-D-alanine carboxypeptidase/D-alanyl-D-alanine-endopeptidase (penicillin-binding protein 4)